MKKMRINDTLYNVCTPAEYNKNPENHTIKFTAVECGDNVLPLNSRITDKATGVYFFPKEDGRSGMVGYVNKPEEGTEEIYSKSHMIDYSKAKDIEEVMANNNLIRDIQNDIIMTSENILSLPITQKDTPHMKALKEAINAKGIDKKSYESRFEQYQNNMRLLKGNDITLKKLIEVSNAFDINVEITLSDKSGINNPIGRSVTASLTEEDGGIV